MSFCYVNTNNASSGLREKVLLTNLVPNYGRKQLVSNIGWGGRGGTPGRTIFIQRNYLMPLSLRWPRGPVRGYM